MGYGLKNGVISSRRISGPRFSQFAVILIKFPQSTADQYIEDLSFVIYDEMTLSFMAMQPCQEYTRPMGRGR
jgi:hypothetical protein